MTPCPHGSLERQCLTCDQAKEIVELQAKLEKLNLKLIMATVENEKLREALIRAEKVSSVMMNMHFENGEVMSPEAQLSVACAMNAEIRDTLAKLPHTTLAAEQLREALVEANDQLKKAYNSTWTNSQAALDQRIANVLKVIQGALALSHPSVKEFLG